MAQTSPNPAGPGGASPDSRPASGGGRGLAIFVGVLFILAGIFSIAFPFVSSLAATLVIGWLFVFVGIVSIIHVFTAGGWRAALWYGLVGAIFLIGGILLIGRPILGALSLTLVIASMFIIEGIVEIIGAFSMRDRPNWGWLLLSGIIALAAGLSVANNFPSSATWLIGLLVGLNLIFSGISYIMDPHEQTVA